MLVVYILCGGTQWVTLAYIHCGGLATPPSGSGAQASWSVRIFVLYDICLWCNYTHAVLLEPSLGIAFGYSCVDNLRSVLPSAWYWQSTHYMCSTIPSVVHTTPMFWYIWLQSCKSPYASLTCWRLLSQIKSARIVRSAVRRFSQITFSQCPPHTRSPHLQMSRSIGRIAWTTHGTGLVNASTHRCDRLVNAPSIRCVFSAKASISWCDLLVIHGFRLYRALVCIHHFRYPIRKMRGQTAPTFTITVGATSVIRM